MKEVVERIDFCSERFQATHGRLSYALSLIDPDKEYRAFLDTHKSAPPAWMDFDLVSPLLSNQSGKYEGTLKPDRLAVDDLTIHDLRNRLDKLKAVKMVIKDVIIVHGKLTVHFILISLYRIRYWCIEMFFCCICVNRVAEIERRIGAARDDVHEKETQLRQLENQRNSIPDYSSHGTEAN